MDQSALCISPTRPDFGSNLFEDPDSFFFYHTVDVPTWTLRVQVLGPNLTFAFQHRQTSGHLHASALAKKTVGFLVITRSLPSNYPTTPGSDTERQIITWAQSGHGMGERGDSLVPADFCLRNKYWTKRTIQLARTLGVHAAHPFDQGNSDTFDEERVGAYRAAHVEVKLATHAVHTLLQAFQIPHDKKNICRETLDKLRLCRHQDGSMPVVEIYFSRKNCIPCGMFVQRLQISTGISFRLIWRHRLVRMQFKNEMDPVGPQLPEGPIVVDDSDDDNPVWLGEAIDIDAPSESGRSTPLIQEFIEVEDDEDDAAGDVQVVEAAERLQRIDSTTLQPADVSSQHARQQQTAAIDGFLDSVSFALGQFAFRPDTARAAVVELARGMRNQDSRRCGDTIRTPASQRCGRREEHQPHSAPGRIEYHRDRSLTPGRPIPRRPRASSTVTMAARDRSASPDSVIMLRSSPCQQVAQRRRQRDREGERERQQVIERSS